MPVDEVAVSREKLRLAAEGGSLSNEAKLRADIEEFQQRNRGYKPSIVDASSAAEKIFAADLVKLRYLEKETTNHETRQLVQILIRMLVFLDGSN